MKGSPNGSKCGLADVGVVADGYASTATLTPMRHFLQFHSRAPMPNQKKPPAPGVTQAIAIAAILLIQRAGLGTSFLCMRGVGFEPTNP